MDASLRGFGKQIQLVLGEVQIRGNLVFVGRDEPFDVFLDQLDGRRPAGLAVIAQRTVLPCRQLECGMSTTAVCLNCPNTLPQMDKLLECTGCILST